MTAYSPGAERTNRRAVHYREIGPAFEPDEWKEWRVVMEFRLVYEGPLRPTGNRSSADRLTIKHLLRRHFHPQLKQLWNTHPGLRALNRDLPAPDGSLADSSTMNIFGIAVPDQEGRSHMFESILSNRFRAGDFKFVPLISTVLGLTCGLDVLFLRREEPGLLLKQGGDIDGRMKTLLDALRMPEVGEICEAPEADERPFFCLLQNDSLVTDINITTDRLLTPLQNEQSKHNVHLIIRVTTRSSVAMWENLPLL